MSASYRPYTRFVRPSLFLAAALNVVFLTLSAALTAQSVPPALVSPLRGRPRRVQTARSSPGCRSFMTPRPMTSTSIRATSRSSMARVSPDGTPTPASGASKTASWWEKRFEGKTKGNNYIVYRGEKTRDFDLKLQMKIEKGGGGGIQYRSVTGLPWTRPQPNGQPPYDLKFMMTGPQADFWFPVTARTASYTGQWYSENTMQGILAYRGQVTQALPGQTNRLVANIGDIQALGGYVKVNDWNDYEIIARGGVMMHIMNGQLMAVFIDDTKDSVNNQPGLIGFEIESQPCKISVRDIWLRSFD